MVLFLKFEFWKFLLVFGNTAFMMTMQPWTTHSYIYYNLIYQQYVTDVYIHAVLNIGFSVTFSGFSGLPLKT